jgi:hypothetical protein
MNKPTARRELQFVFSNLTISLILMLFTTNLLAQGDLLIFPKRVVFEGNKKYQEVDLANTGKDTARYIISFVQIRMKDDGGFENITKPDPGQQFADSYLRIFPRNVILGPGEAQLLKIQLTKTNLLTPGEYRSHIYFRSEHEKKPLTLGEKKPAKDSIAISVSLVPIYGMTIPVIIRVGESTTQMNLSDISFVMANDTIPTVKMTINRTGNMSVYGDIKVEYISPSGGTTQVGNVRGVAVYTPNLLRRTAVKLNNMPDVDYRTGKLHVIYSSQREDKNGILAETELHLQ